MKQKRLWFSAILLFLVVGSLFTLFKPQATSAASKGCVNGASGVDECTVLVVTLTGNGALPTNVTVTAQRKAQFGTDDNVTLNSQTFDSWIRKTKLPANSYTTVNGLADTQNTGQTSACADPANNPGKNLFSITVKQNGDTIGTASDVNMCSDVKTEDKWVHIKKVSVPVNTATSPASKGGIAGKAGWADTVNNGTGKCSADSVIDVWGGPDNISQSSPKQFHPDTTSGRYDTGFSLTPGLDYNVSIICFDSSTNDPGRNTYTDTKSGVAVQAGKSVTVDFATTGMANQGGGQVDVTACADGSQPDAGGSCASTDNAPTINCSVQWFNPLSWFLCPLATALETVVSGLDNQINNYLEVKPGQGSYTSSCDKGDQWCSYYKPWSVIRDIALALIVVLALVAIISQAIGLEIFDAYTLRKVLPRLLIAIIGIALSWPLMMFFINLMNDIGLGIRGLIYAPFQGFKVALGGGGQFVSSFFLGGAILGLGFAGLLSFVATAALAVAVAFLVLVLRQMVIVMLVIFSPIAIACFVLPNTQKAWKLWWDSFSRALLMFPIITGFIAIGRVFAAVNTNNTSAINQIIAFTAYFAPYFMIPFTFRLAGGAVATLGGLVNDRSRGAFDRLRKYRGNKIAQNMHDMKTGNRFKGDSWAAGAFNATSRNIANIPNAGLVPWKMRSRMQAAGARHEGAELAEYMEKNAAFAAIKGNDDYLQATMATMGGGEHESDWRRYLQRAGYSGRSLEQGVALIRAAKRDVSNEIFERAAVMANPATGTGWKEGGAAQMMESINHVAGNDRHLAATMLAQMRSSASQAGRLDLAGSGFGTQLTALNDMHSGAITREEANERVYEGAIFTKAPGEFARARGNAIANLAPQMLKHMQKSHARVEKARAGGNVEEIARAERSLAQDYAWLDNLHDNLNYSSPEVARTLADSVLSQQVAPGVSIMGNIQALQREGSSSAMGQAYLDTKKSYDARQYADRQGRPSDEG